MAQEHGPQDLLIAKVMRDDAFRQRLLRDPNSALKEIGATVPSGITVHVCEETAKDLYLVIPGPAYSSLNQLSGALGKLAGISFKEGPTLVGPVVGGPTGPTLLTECCTCGVSTSQTIMTLQKGCGCD